LQDLYFSIQETAVLELSEEGRLTGGEMIRLLPDGHEGIPEVLALCSNCLQVKWCQNKFIPFLCMDPIPDPNPLPRDAEGIIKLITWI
jgi:hypothetical protein